MELIWISLLAIGGFVLFNRRDRRKERRGQLFLTPEPPQAPRWRTAVAVGRFEARKLLRHPAFVFGMVISPLALMGTLAGETAAWVISAGLVIGLVPLGWMAIVATNLATLRSRRHGTEELEAALPTSQATRTTGVVLASIATLPVSLVLLTAAFLVVGTNPDLIGGLRPWEIAPAAFIVMGGAIVGVLVGRWLPHPAFAIAAIVATTALQGRWASSDTSPVRWMGFQAGFPGSRDPFLELRPTGWHLLYLAGLVLLVAAVAVARHGLSQPLVGGLVAALVVVAIGGWMQTRPMSDAQAEERAAYLTEPDQVCEDHEDVSYCAYPAYRDWIDEWREPVEGVLARVPDQDRHLEVSQRPPPVVGNSSCGPSEYLDAVPQRLADELTPQALWPADGDVHPTINWPESFPCGGRDTHGVFLGVQTGAWAVGLPPASSPPEPLCRADGQARAVMALWLGAQVADQGSAVLADLIADAEERDTGEHLTFDDDVWDNPPPWGVEWRIDDLLAAHALLEQPTHEVESVLAADWYHLTDPDTSSAELFDAVGVSGPDAGAARTAARAACA